MLREHPKGKEGAAEGTETPVFGGERRTHNLQGCAATAIGQRPQPQLSDIAHSVRLCSEQSLAVARFLYSLKS